MDFEKQLLYLHYAECGCTFLKEIVWINRATLSFVTLVEKHGKKFVLQARGEQLPMFTPLPDWDNLSRIAGQFLG